MSHHQSSLFLMCVMLCDSFDYCLYSSPLAHEWSSTKNKYFTTYFADVSKIAFSGDIIDFHPFSSSSLRRRHIFNLSLSWKIKLSLNFTYCASYSWWRHQTETFFALLALCAWNSLVTGDFPSHKGQWRGALIFSLICTWINRWVNIRKSGDLRRHRVHYDVSVMILNFRSFLSWLSLRQSHLIQKFSSLWISRILHYI